MDHRPTAGTRSAAREAVAERKSLALSKANTEAASQTRSPTTALNATTPIRKLLHVNGRAIELRSMCMTYPNARLVVAGAKATAEAHTTYESAADIAAASPRSFALVFTINSLSMNEPHIIREWSVGAARVVPLHCNAVIKP